VPYNPGAIPEAAYAPSECFVVEAQQSTEEAVASAIPNFVDTAGTSSAAGQSVSKGRKEFLSSSDSTSEDESYDNASEICQALRSMNFLLFMNCAHFLK
jgi:hypothetical protein